MTDLRDGVSEEARALVARSLVWDNHGCMPLRPRDESFLPQLERYRAAGVDVVSMNVGFGPQPLEDHLRMIASFRHWLARHADRYTLAGTSDDVRAATAAGKLAVVFDVEGMGFLEPGDLSVIGLLRDLGVRWMLVAYNRGNHVGSGIYDDADGGLTAFGREVLAEMRRVGMVVCCSHTGERTAMEVMEHAGGPVILSHSNARAVHDHPRNISDALALACARTGGVIGVNGIGPFLGDNDNSTGAVVRHIDHLVQRVGPEHVGLGLDYVFDAKELEEYLAKMSATFPGPQPTGGLRMVEPERVEAITAALLGLGYPEDAVARILGGNWLRIADAVWRRG